MLNVLMFQKYNLTIIDLIWIYAGAGLLSFQGYLVLGGHFGDRGKRVTMKFEVRPRSQHHHNHLFNLR